MPIRARSLPDELNRIHGLVTLRHRVRDRDFHADDRARGLVELADEPFARTTLLRRVLVESAPHRGVLAGGVLELELAHAFDTVAEHGPYLGRVHRFLESRFEPVEAHVLV